MLSKLIKLCRIAQAGINGQKVFTQKVEYNGKVSEPAVMLPYGLHANAPAGSAGIMLALNGMSENIVTIPWDSDNRPDLDPGETAFYHPSTLSTIIWKKNGDLQIDSLSDSGSGNIIINCATASINADTSVTITSPETKIDGNLEVTGDTDLGSVVNSNGTDIGENHTHAGSPTAPSGPVSNTGAPV